MEIRIARLILFSPDNIDPFYCRKMYFQIMEMGMEAFDKTSHLYQLRNTPLLPAMIAHFEAWEDYEKCHELRQLSKMLRWVK